MKVMSVIASAILVLVPTISLILAIVKGKKNTATLRQFAVGVLLPNIGTWLLVLVIYYFAGVFKNF